ncbi:hypothetical protein PFLG_02641, partial [Plasmodium falciparum RAJ116]
LNTKKRLITKYPKIIPSPLKDLFQYVTDLENTKVINNEIKSKKLKEKQIEHVKNKKGNKQILMKQKENQSYSSLFMRYMQSDDEKSNSTVENDKNEEHNEDTLSNESMMSTDFLEFLLKTDEHKKSLDNVINEDIYEQQNSHETETERDDLQTMQDYRR